MKPPRSRSLRSQSAWHVLEGFGASTRIAARYVRPSTTTELADVLDRARREALTVAFRAAGQSYGDVALNAEGLVVDLSALKAIRDWNPQSGVVECGPGTTIEDLWRHTLADGYWPYVVPGTMRPTLGGCLSTNVHGKNNWRAGTFGDHVLDFDLLTPQGESLTCSRAQHAEVFFAAIGGVGLLGAITRIRLELKKVETGLLEVESASGASLEGVLAEFERLLEKHEYVVSWIDATASGAGLGRGELHGASYLPATRVTNAPETLRVERQSLPSHLMGVPKSHLWRLMRPVMSDAGVRLVNAAKYAGARLKRGSVYTQSHAAFAFLLDYVPNWRRAYGDSGFIQYQVFVPYETGLPTLRAILECCRQRRIPPYLAVLKRHRADDFLLTYSLDGWSLAIDFPIGNQRDELWRLTHELTAIALDSGGRFYFAKDSVLKAEDVSRFFGQGRLERFCAIKSRLDPSGTLSSDLWRRIAPRSSAILSVPGETELPSPRPV